MPNRVTLKMTVEVDVDLDDWILVYGNSSRHQAQRDAAEHVPAVVADVVRSQLRAMGNGASFRSVSQTTVHPHDVHLEV